MNKNNEPQYYYWSWKAANDLYLPRQLQKDQNNLFLQTTTLVLRSALNDKSLLVKLKLTHKVRDHASDLK